jgi:Protein of unknown function (DUF1573)
MARFWLASAVGSALCLFSVVVAPCAPAAPKADAGEPKLVMEKTEFDAGKVAVGEIIRVVFPVRNVGHAPLHIFDIKKDCGCIVPSFDELILPGETGHVRVALRSAGFQGPVEKHVYMETDDPVASSVSLTIKAIVPRAVEVTPGTEVQMRVTRGTPATTEVTLRSTDETPLAIGPIASPLPYVTAEVVPGGHDPHEARLRLTVTAEAPTDTFETRIAVSTGHYRLGQVALHLFVQPAAAVTVQPTHLSFGRVRPSEKGPLTRVLTLARASGAFHVLKMEDSRGCLHAEVLPGGEDSFCEVKLTYLGGWKDERTTGTLHITTDDPARPEIDVPYTAEVW